MSHRHPDTCSIRRKPCWFLLICVSGLIAVASAGGCDRPPPASGPPPEPIHVLCSVYAMADLVRQVGGERVDVEWLVESGQPLNNIEVTSERRNTFRTADLVLTRGALEPWM